MESTSRPNGVERLCCVALFLVLSALMATGPWWSPSARAQGFTDATSLLGIEIRSGSEPRADYGSGAAFADFDGDGSLDLYVVMGKDQPNRL